MSGRSLPEPRRPDPTDPVRPRALALPAVGGPRIDERRPWLERADVVDAVSVPGLDSPLYLDGDGVAVTTTGLGKAEAATTVATLLASAAIDLDGAYVLSAGVAGAAPARAALGSVFLADVVVDWDRKHRWDRDDGGPSVAPLAYEPGESVRRLDPTLVEVAAGTARGADLTADPAVEAYADRYPEAGGGEPTVGVGPTVAGDEFWHGPRHAREVDALCERYGVEPYATTQMEDSATAAALDRHGLLGRYLSVRAVANYDRPAPDQSVEESFDGTEESLALAIENAGRVGWAVVEGVLSADPLGLGEA